MRIRGKVTPQAPGGSLTTSHRLVSLDSDLRISTLTLLVKAPVPEGRRVMPREILSFIEPDSQTFTSLLYSDIESNRNSAESAPPLPVNTNRQVRIPAMYEIASPPVKTAAKKLQRLHGEQEASPAVQRKCRSTFSRGPASLTISISCSRRSGSERSRRCRPSFQFGKRISSPFS